MSRLRVHGFTLSLDGYAAGPDQSRDHPTGVGGRALHEWLLATRTFRLIFGGEQGDEGMDDAFAAQGSAGIGATIMGRNMFGPVRGPWGGERRKEDRSNDSDYGEWRGWWGADPPFHHPVFVLTRYPRASITMQGGTTFHFVGDGIEAALARAKDAANGMDVRVGGGASTIQQYLRAGLIDEMHLAIVPVLLGSGERLFDNMDGGPVGYECVEFVASPSVMHVRLVRTAPEPAKEHPAATSTP